LEHKPLIPRSEKTGAGIALCSAEEIKMVRENWQVLLFGLILLALCFVQ